MARAGHYAVVVAPSALAQMESALDWWAANREKAPGLLAREIEVALALIEHAPNSGRRVANKLLRGVRRLVLQRTGYLLDYQLVESDREVRVVHFRQGRRRPR